MCYLHIIFRDIHLVMTFRPCDRTSFLPLFLILRYEAVWMYMYYGFKLGNLNYISIMRSHIYQCVNPSRLVLQNPTPTNAASNLSVILCAICGPCHLLNQAVWQPISIKILYDIILEREMFQTMHLFIFSLVSISEIICEWWIGHRNVFGSTIIFFVDLCVLTDWNNWIWFLSGNVSRSNCVCIFFSSFYIFYIALSPLVFV